MVVVKRKAHGAWPEDGDYVDESKAPDASTSRLRQFEICNGRSLAGFFLVGGDGRADAVAARQVWLDAARDTGVTRHSQGCSATPFSQKNVKPSPANSWGLPRGSPCAGSSIFRGLRHRERYTQPEPRTVDGNHERPPAMRLSPFLGPASSLTLSPQPTPS